MGKRALVVMVVLVVAGLGWPVAAGQDVAVPGRTPNTLRLADGASSPKAGLADLAWLAGHWEGTGLGGQSEEVWAAPAGGAMVGMYRQIMKGEVAFYEIMTLTEERGTVVLRLKHFNADLTGWEEKNDSVTFRLVKAAPREAFFEGLTYRLVEPDRLQIFLALQFKDGSVREETFNLRRRP